MVTTATIKIWGENAAGIYWDDQRKLANFQYISSFLKKQWDLAPIQMPLKQENAIHTFPEFSRNATFKGLPGLIADTLPDHYGNELINSWLLKNGRAENSMNPVEQLCFIGKRGMGALEFMPSRMPETLNNFKLEFDSLIDVTKKMLEKRKQFTTNLQENEQKAIKDILKIGTSAGGARPKAIITYNPKSGEVRSGQADADKNFEHWLLKLDAVSDAQFGTSNGYGRIEMAYYQMATNCGIKMMPSKLFEENGRAHFMTKRFDRENNEKHHVQTFCAMRHFDFNEMNSFSYEQLFETMRILRLTYPEAEEMYRRMVFNVIARNCDDHTKNFAFRMKKDQKWELAPAYDICHAYRPGSIWVSQHTLSINGKRKDINRNDLLKIAENNRIKRAKEIIEQVTETVSNWKSYADQFDVENEKKEAIAKTLVLL